MSENRPKQLSTGMWVFLSVLLAAVITAALAVAVIVTQNEHRLRTQARESAKLKEEEDAKFDNAWRRKACFDDAQTSNDYDMCNKRYPVWR